MLVGLFGSKVVSDQGLRSAARVTDRMPTEDCVDSVLAAPGLALEAAANPYLAPALRAAAAARARTAHIRAAQIGLAPIRQVMPVAGSQAATGATAASGVDRHADGAAAPPLRGGRFVRTMAEIERQLAAPTPAAAPGFPRRPPRLSGYAVAPRPSLWARLWCGFARWVFE